MVKSQIAWSFLRIIFGCPEGARKWRILFFAMLLHSKMIFFVPNALKLLKVIKAQFNTSPDRLLKL